MKFTFIEWGKIKHSLEVAYRAYEEQMSKCQPSDQESSMYQIFKRQMEDTKSLIKRIETAEI